MRAGFSPASFTLPEARTRPVMATWDCRMIGVFHTTRQPMRGFVDKLQAMEGKDGVLSVQAAAGIVADSVPESEWQETENKARALLRAADRAQAGLDAQL